MFQGDRGGVSSKLFQISNLKKFGTNSVPNFSELWRGFRRLFFGSLKKFDKFSSLDRPENACYLLSRSGTVHTKKVQTIRIIAVIVVVIFAVDILLFLPFSVLVAILESYSVCLVTHIDRVRINRVTLPILHVIS